MVAFITAIVDSLHGYPSSTVALAAAAIVVSYTAYLYSSKPRTPTGFSLLKAHGGDVVKKQADNYCDFYAEGSSEAGVDARKKGYADMVNAYYDIATDFYEYGWGRSFHFAPRWKTETFPESIVRLEHLVAKSINLKKGMKVIDVGCGVGGPMRTICRFTGAEIVGINNNAYQIMRGNKHNAAEEIAHLCSFQKADFMKLSEHFKPNSLDGAYAIEATCHAPDPTKCYRSVYDVIKPGATFAALEWCVTDKYDPNNAEHRAVKLGIEEGDSLPDMVTTKQCVQNFKDAGFEIVEVTDIATANHYGNIPWYQPFVPSLTPSGFKTTPLGIWATHIMVTVLEFFRLAPKGTVKAHTVLTTAAKSLYRGGVLEIFTPSFLVVARKPMK